MRTYSAAQRQTEHGHTTVSAQHGEWHARTAHGEAAWGHGHGRGTATHSSKGDGKGQQRIGERHAAETQEMQVNAGRERVSQRVYVVLLG